MAHLCRPSYSRYNAGPSNRFVSKNKDQSEIPPGPQFRAALAVDESAVF